MGQQARSFHQPARAGSPCRECGCHLAVVRGTAISGSRRAHRLSTGRAKPSRGRLHRLGLGRLAAWAMVLLAALTVWLLPGGAAAGPFAGPFATGARLRSVAHNGSVAYVVRPGDTLWSIAARLDPSAPRYAVARLEARDGTARVFPGERICVPLTPMKPRAGGSGNC